MKNLMLLSIAAGLCLMFCGAAGAQSLENRLNRIMIKKIEVEEAKIKDVFELIRERSKEADPEGKGVNFVFQDVPDGAVTISLTDVPLSKVIEYVCLAAKLKFKIDTHAVIISKDKTPEKKSEK